MTEKKPEARVPVVAGGNIAALIPQSLEEAFRVSTAIAGSGLAPKGLDRPEQILVAIMAGAELGLAPFQSLQSFAVVNGRPTLWGDGLMAVARAGGVRVKEWLEGADDDAVAFCEVTRPEGEVITRKFSVGQAKKAGLWGKPGPWQQYPTRMLGMRARAYALRDGCADMLRGFQVREEVEDYEVVRNVTLNPGTGMRARLEARQAEVEPNGGFDAEYVEKELSVPPDEAAGDRTIDVQLEMAGNDSDSEAPSDGFAPRIREYRDRVAAAQSWLNIKQALRGLLKAQDWDRGADERLALSIAWDRFTELGDKTDFVTDVFLYACWLAGRTPEPSPDEVTGNLKVLQTQADWNRAGDDIQAWVLRAATGRHQS